MRPTGIVIGVFVAILLGCKAGKTGPIESVERVPSQVDDSTRGLMPIQSSQPDAALNYDQVYDQSHALVIGSGHLCTGVGFCAPGRGAIVPRHPRRS